MVTSKPRAASSQDVRASISVNGIRMAARTEVISQLTSDPEWMSSVKQSTSIHAAAPSLKVFHVLDLLRLLEELRTQSRIPAETPQLFPILIAAILHPFARIWHCQSPDDAKEQEIYLINHHLAFHDAAKVFYRRWNPEQVRIDPIPLPPYSHDLKPPAALKNTPEVRLAIRSFIQITLSLILLTAILRAVALVSILMRKSSGL
ncbi:hypothetical protein DL93DRAFT_931928 [Clavulina sp. PMI_390]|nr:hypothetical protein DL93DRAFT_931928 [Clavulina sp. PMI_390]